jgi:glycerophosphoryl diester phosphodiesterase
VSLPAGLLAPSIAHRGLWRTGGAPENSLAAFEAACRAGYGIELDVQLSADGEAMVFHDEVLERLTVEAGLVEERTAEELQALRLLGSDQRIPALGEALDLIGGRALVLVELKTPPGQEGALEQRVADLLAAHAGPAGVLSFNAQALACMARKAPHIARGLNAKDVAAFAEATTARADFLSVHAALAPCPEVQAWRQTGKAVAWTVRSAAERDRLKGLVDNIIFEGFAG